METKNIKKIPYCLGFIISGALLFALANPGFIFKQGFAFTAWFMFVPCLFFVKHSSFKNCWFYSGLYGLLCTGAYAFWLYNYSPLCLAITLVIAFAGSAVAGTILKLIEKLFVKNAWLVQFIALCAFDYLRTLGFLGCNYGIAAYTQWKFNTLIQSAGLTGVFGLNAFVIFSSCVIYSILSKLEDKKQILKLMVMDDRHYEGATYVNYVSDADKKYMNTSLVLPFITAGLWGILFVCALVYGRHCLNNKKDYNYITVAAIQHNDNPEDTGIANYSESIHELMSLTDEALEINPEISIVLWPETAVVPSIMYNYAQDNENERKKLITHLLNYMNSRSCCFVIGNQHIETGAFKQNKKYYNSVLVFNPGENVIPPQPKLYSKIHLVPFSEYFPYEKYFPHIYKALLEHEKFFWTPSDKLTVFSERGLDFYTPVCYENTFPDLTRKACKEGAECIMCLVNDSWSKSIACQMQHLAMAKFRAVENHIPVVISSVSGQTAVIQENGQLSSMAMPFSKTYVIDQIPLIPKGEKTTFYNRIGDIFGYGTAFLLLILLIIRIFIAIIRYIIYGRSH